MSGMSFIFTHWGIPAQPPTSGYSGTSTYWPTSWLSGTPTMCGDSLMTAMSLKQTNPVIRATWSTSGIPAMTGVCATPRMRATCGTNPFTTSRSLGN